ncbi:MAG: hypothetical protein BAA03_07390 [Caldibacillus debilis]|nr:MAG: hypothetical protein BAA03_07390 [Caldibacillus debilis]
MKIGPGNRPGRFLPAAGKERTSRNNGSSSRRSGGRDADPKSGQRFPPFTRKKRRGTPRSPTGGMIRCGGRAKRADKTGISDSFHFKK